jgi:hypothetical protein
LPWVASEQLRRDGLLIICPQNEDPCLEQAAALTQPGGIEWRQEFARSFLGLTAKSQTYVLFVQPPASLR